MEQEIILNEHNKQKHSTMQKRRVDTFVNIRMVILIVGIFILCSCQNASESSVIVEEETNLEVVNVEDTLTDNWSRPASSAASAASSSAKVSLMFVSIVVF